MNLLLSIDGRAEGTELFQNFGMRVVEANSLHPNVNLGVDTCMEEVANHQTTLRHVNSTLGCGYPRAIFFVLDAIMD